MYNQFKNPGNHPVSEEDIVVPGTGHSIGRGGNRQLVEYR
jgi:hypothetical protein